MQNANLFLCSAVAGVFFVAACGGAPAEVVAPSAASSSSAASSASGSPSSAGSSAPSASASAASSAQAPAPPVAEFSGPMTPIAATTMTADLQAIGLDAKALPTLAKLEPEKLRKVMRTFTKSLGMKCGDCHNESDFSAPTPMKKIATHMWDDYVRALAMGKSDPIYCDSCHQGRAKLLDRHDKKALSKWMNANFVDKLSRRDKKEHGCETCHGDPFESQILAAWVK